MFFSSSFRIEHSSDQVVKPINLEALRKWIGHIPIDVLEEIDSLAPMLSRLGYDTKSYEPNYGMADQFVLDNMNKLKVNAEFWNEKAKSYARQNPNLTELIEKERFH